MVKPLKIFGHSIKWAMLLTLLVVLGLGIWLHQGERSLSFVKPWMEEAINHEQAPYTISIGDVTVNWTNVTTLGKMRIKDVAFAKRDGSVFAQFPELYATIDPLWFLPDRRLLHRVILRNPHIFAVRNTEGAIEFGFENTSERMSLAEVMAFLSISEGAEGQSSSVSLPFRDLAIDNASFSFTDEATQTNITSDAFDVALKRHHGTYDALVSLPFMVDAQPVMISGGVRAIPQSREHVFAITMKEFPVRLVCLFGTCPEGVELEGGVDGLVAVSVADADLSVRGFSAKLSSKRSRLNAPKWFAETLKLGASKLHVEGDWSKRIIFIRPTKIQLEDTAINAQGEIRKGEDGWYVKADGAASRLDIRKLYKYWPLALAPESRLWVTNKLKSGYGENASLKIDMTPADFAAEYFSDASIHAVVEARDITFEYLPGFPLVEKMDGLATFSAMTLKVEGGGGSLMKGTRVNKATLWCPELHSDRNPMETTLDLTAPASDVVTLLALKQFPFDDHLKLDAATIAGELGAKLKLKFNAFSENSSDDPSALNLDAVDYDIAVDIRNAAQKNVHDAYDIHAINGTLKADMKGLSFNGTVDVGEAEVNAVSLEQASGNPLKVSVQGKPGKESRPLNDFTLTYTAGEVPQIRLAGKRLDGSVSYGNKENSLLADFPAIKLDVDVGELVLSRDMPFTGVKGHLHCTKLRCESADITASAGDAVLRTTITQQGGKRQFSMTSDDAGATLKAFDITDRMTKGKLELKGDYVEEKTPPQLNARLIITDFTLKNSQILGRIFSIGSLTGLANALTGQGIAFEKLAANIDSHKGVIVVDKGVAQGAAMGITVEGVVDTNTAGLDLKGVLAPAYALNSILGKIPVIGAIAGGEEGLIAFNYAIKGKYEDPEVSVNPLSGFTPGFLRGIFGGGTSGGLKPIEKTKDKTPVGERNRATNRP